MPLRRCQDAFGKAMHDAWRGKLGNVLVIERDDGLIDADFCMKVYLSGPKGWPPHMRRALALARGRVLDVGCGAGRHSLYLQQKGLEVLGIDNSPLAVRLCRERGVAAKTLSITELSPKHGMFDTILMLGNNFGLLGGRRRGRAILRRFHRMTAPGARIIAETFDPYLTDNPVHLAYHRRNRRRGRMGGQVRIRARYQTLATPYFDYLFVSKAELASLLRGTGWRAARFLDGPGPAYIAVLEKAQTPG